MALIVEDGTGLATAESYISVAEADTYHVKFGNASWSLASSTNREIALRKATRYIDANYRFAGSPRVFTQALQWPRVDAYRNGWVIPLDEIPDVLKQAIAETALLALTINLFPTIAAVGGLRSVQVDVIRKEYFEPSNDRPVYYSIDDILAPLLGISAGSLNMRLERA